MEQPGLHAARLATLAFAHAECESYIRTYIEVMRQFESEKGKSLLVPIVNQVLQRMVTDKSDVYRAANALMKEMANPRSRMFVMAAAVDIALNDRSAGDVVTSIPTADETLARVAA